MITNPEASFIEMLLQNMAPLNGELTVKLVLYYYDGLPFVKRYRLEKSEQGNYLHKENGKRRFYLSCYGSSGEEEQIQMESIVDLSPITD